MIDGFAECAESYFIVATHLVELSEKIKNKKIIYKCFLSGIKDRKIIYPFKITDGISNERMGITILKNEGILKMIKDIRERNKKVKSNLI